MTMTKSDVFLHQDRHGHCHSFLNQSQILPHMFLIYLCHSDELQFEFFKDHRVFVLRGTTHILGPAAINTY